MGRKDKPIAENGEKLSIGMILRQARQAKGLSLTAMAERLNLTKGHLSGVENDRVKPSVRLLQKYEQFLELQPGELSEKELRPLNPAHFLASWNVPFARNPFFMGREDLLMRIHQQLQAGQTTILSQKQAISGLGGIGKTQLAVEYAYRFCEKYQAVLWVQAETIDTLNASYLELAHLLLLPERDAPEQAVVVQAIKRWLQTRQNWLLILDNADEPELLMPFLPPILGGQVLLTTRAAALRSFGIVHPLIVDTFSPQLGALFLLRRAGLLAPDAPPDQASAHEFDQALQITRELGGLPLALDQAGAYIEATGTSLDLYQQIYQNHRAELLRERRGGEGDHPEPVTTTWLLSFQRVEEKNPAAADLLRLCAFLAPDAIGEEIITQGYMAVGKTPPSVATDAYLLDQAIETLRAYSLLMRDAQSHTLSIHRLVQAVIRDALPTNSRLQWMHRAVRAVAAVFPPGTFEHWPQCERLLPHALLCARWIEEQKISTPEAATLLHRIGHYQSERGRYSEVEHLHKLALTMREQNQEENSELADSLMYLGYFYSGQGRYEKAEHFYERALAIRERVLGPEHPETAQSVSSLGDLSLAQGKYAQARPLYERALDVRERMLGPEHPETAQSVDHLAGLYSRQGLYAQARPLYERALAIRERVLGPEHPETLRNLNNLAGLYSRQGLYAQAQPLYERALAITQEILGPEHPETAQSLHNLAGLSSRQGLYAQARPLYERSLAIRERVLGPEHPETAQSLHNLAGLSSRQGLYAQAQPLYERALAIRERVLGPAHPETAQSLNNLGYLSLVQGKYTQAQLLYERALAIRERVLGPAHPETAQSLNNLAGLYSRQGLYAQAQPLYERALAIREHILGPEHPDTVRNLHNLAGLYHSQGLYAQAQPLYERALAIRERVLGPEHPETAQSLHNLAELYRNLDRNEEAESLHQRALGIRERVLGPEHPETAQSLHNLARLYDKQGRNKEAGQLYQRALAIYEHALGPEHPQTQMTRDDYLTLLPQKE